MPTETPRQQRLLRKAREALVAGEARLAEARLAREPRWSRAFREIREARIESDQRLREIRESRATTDVRESLEAGEVTLAPEQRGPRSFQDGHETRLATGRLVGEFVESRAARQPGMGRMAPQRQIGLFEESQAARQAASAHRRFAISQEIREATPALERQLREVEDAVAAREARESEWNREIEERARRAIAAIQEPVLVLNRATTLLACICILRLRGPDLSGSFLADLLGHNFPEIAIRARDIETLFRATCFNRPSWVRNMRRPHVFEERLIALSMIALLQQHGLAHMPQLPQQRYRDRREAIRYLQDLVGAPNEEGVVNSPNSWSSFDF